LHSHQILVASGALGFHAQFSREPYHLTQETVDQPIKFLEWAKRPDPFFILLIRGSPKMSL
jgi:hypothetical protein